MPTRTGFIRVSIDKSQANIYTMGSGDVQSVAECVYCGGFCPKSRDHIPPACLFAEPRPSDLITVPSCQMCNAGFSLDDEYFRLAITTGMDPSKFPKEFGLSTQAIRKLGNPKKLGLAKKMLSNFSKEPIYTPAGLYLGKAGALTVDAARVQRVVERVVRGLFFHHFGKRLPTTGRISVVSDWFVPVLPEELLTSVEVVRGFLNAAEPNVIGSGVFCYRYRTIEEELYGSVWWLSFYDHRRFLCSTEQIEQECKA